MPMTKKDFEAIAEIVHNRVDTYNQHNTLKARGTISKMMLEDLTAELADYLSTTNNKFDRFKFYAATGINETVYTIPEDN